LRPDGTGDPPVQESPLESQDRDDRHAEDFMLIGNEMSWLAKVLNLIALTTVVGAAVAFLWLMSSLPYIEGQVPVKGLDMPATVSRDVHGIPRIAARSQHDAYFALGYAHAQDRLWQMEVQRRVGAGRLAEVVGEKGLDNDRFMRTLGLYHLAEATLTQLDKPTRNALIAYSEGVNSWIDAHRHRLPLEFLVLGHRPEPWKPADSLVWQRLMALQLANNWHDQALRAELAGLFDAKHIGELFPPYPADQPVTLSSAAALRDVVPPDAEPRLASNVWVVAGNRSASGKPLLANDPHLGFRAPILWYLASIEAPGLTVAGATVPGTPFHLVGHNGRIAWGLTATHATTINLFVEKLAGEWSYQTPEGPRPFDTRHEVIHVKGGADVDLSVRISRHGPVISDLAAKGVAKPGEVVTFASTALAADDLTAQAFLRLNHAIDWKGFVAALKDFGAPVQNVAYADTMGNIGFYTAGRVPLRKSGDGTVPARGWTGEGDWTGWVPFAKLPQAYNPPAGVIVNANNKVVPNNYPYPITADWPPGYRAQRIREVLDQRRTHTIDDMAALQLDTLSLQAIELKELIGGVEAKSPRAREAARIIAAWDGRADRDRPEPLIFAAWMDRLDRAIFADELKDHMAAMVPVRPAALVAALTRYRHWCDDVTTPAPESCEDMIERSLEEAVTNLTAAYGPDMSRWTWGAAHRAHFSHPILGQVPLLGRWADLEVATDGDDFTVSRGSYMPDEGGTRFPHLHGAGLRAVFDLADLGNSRFVVATGQSGNPLSRHYGDMLEAWRTNRGFRLDNTTGNAVLIMEPEI
jgi:penicillin G amidase